MKLLVLLLVLLFASRASALEHVVVESGSTFTTAQTATATTAALLSAFDGDRRSIFIFNMDATISVFVGNTGVTSATGIPIRPNTGLTMFSKSAVYVVSASGTPTVSVLVEH